MLTNLAHLDSLRVRIAPPSQPGRTTFRLDEEPSVEVVWTYAERLPDGTYLPSGGGALGPDTGHFARGVIHRPQQIVKDPGRGATQRLHGVQDRVPARGWSRSRCRVSHCSGHTRPTGVSGTSRSAPSAGTA